MMLYLKKWTLSLLLLVCSTATFSMTSISLWSGTNYPTGNKHRATLEFLYTGQWHYGDNLFFFNVDNPTSNSTAIEGVWASRLSASKITKKHIKIGPLTDALLAGEYVVSGENLREYALGLGTNWAIPKIKDFIANAYWVRNDTVNGHSYQLEAVWLVPMNLNNRWHFLLSGYAEYYGPTNGTVTDLKANFLAEPSFMLDLGHVLHLSTGKLYAGMQYTYWHHMYGTDINESVPELKVSWVL